MTLYSLINLAKAAFKKNRYPLIDLFSKGSEKEE